MGQEKQTNPKQRTFLRSRQAVLTFDVPGKVQADPGKARFSFQGDLVWLQVTHLDLESLAEDSRHSWQVIDFQHLLLARFDVTLQGVGEEREMAQTTDTLRIEGKFYRTRKNETNSPSGFLVSQS